MDSIKVIIADDEQSVRQALRAVLEAAPGITVVSEETSPVIAHEGVERNGPDVVLMEMRVPQGYGIKWAGHIVSRWPQTRVLLFVDPGDYPFEAIGAGASGFVRKDANPAQIVAAIRAVMRQDAVEAPRITADFVRRAAPEIGLGQRADEIESALEIFSARELEVLRHVTAGATNREIAVVLQLDEAAVETVVRQLLSACRLRDRMQLIIVGFGLGVLRR